MSIAYGIFSGGLDSTLAAKVLLDQGIDVRLITFVTPFFNEKKAITSAALIGLTSRPVEITEQHLKMLIKPKHGYGRFMNPCIDCHALMFKLAGRIMDEERGDFLFSGEVLGQRPKSQMLRALGTVANESEYRHLILRPLSAKNLPVTEMEEKGLVDRDQLFGFTGRSRKPQMALAAELNISGYPTPGGGCLLTDTTFSNRLKELLCIDGKFDPDRVRLLKWGRHFRLPDGSKLIVGRNQKENEEIQELVSPDDIILQVQTIPGPLVIMSGGDGSSLSLAADITVTYSDAKEGSTALVELSGSSSEKEIKGQDQPKSEFVHLMVK